MTAPTIEVTVSLEAMGGPAIEGVLITASLDVNERYDDAIVIAKPITLVTGADGKVVFDLFPNLLVAEGGLGTQGSTYRFTATIPGGRPLDVQARFPNTNCQLEDWLVQSDPILNAFEQQSVMVAKGWATKTEGTVDGDEFSAKEYAQGTQPDTGGSAKAWATSATLPDGVNKSAKTYAAEAAGSAGAAAGSAGAAAGSAAAAAGSAGAAGGSAAAAAGSAGAAAGSATAAGNSAGAAVVSANNAAASEGAAAVSKVAAAASATQAGLYAVNTATGAKFADTIALGRATVADGQTFGVKAGGTDGLVDPSIYRRDSAGTQTYIGRIVQGDFITSPDYSGDPAARSVVLAQDSEGRDALSVASTGEGQAGAFRTNFLNGVRVSSMLLGLAMAYPGGLFTAEIVHFINGGQSNAAGRGTALQTVQDADSIGFAYHVTSPGAFLPLTVANTGNGQESPMYAAASFLKELRAKENGIAASAAGCQLLASNTGYDGFTIAQLSKGQAPYALGINHVSTAYALAAAAGKTIRFGFVTWTQGEADSVLTRSQYNAALKQLAADYDADIRAITLQPEIVPLFTWQVTSVNVLTAGLGQMDAHEESALVYCVCPEYIYRFSDSVHLDAYSQRWLGDFQALAVKRVMDDKVGWEPLKPLGVVKQGNVTLIRFNKRGLVWDTSLVPAQTNYGFTAVDAGTGTPVAITAVDMLPDGRVKVTAAAPNTKVRYACNVATGKGPYAGGAGNLRDSYGDELEDGTYEFPMHNFCVAFEA